MLKRAALTLALILVMVPSKGFCSVQNEITSLDQQRNELLKQITSGLVEGKISIQDAQKLKGQLDNVVKLETTASEEPATGTDKVQDISSSLKEVQKNIADATHPKKVWCGLTAGDRTLETKLNNALDRKAISKVQAEGFQQQLDELSARESNGDPSHGFEFPDAISLAVDKQTLSDKMDEAIAGK